MGLRALAVGVVGLMLLMVPPVLRASSSFGPIQLFLINDIKACTTFAINRQERLWLTAAHCVTTRPDEDHVDGVEPARPQWSVGDISVKLELIRFDPKYDIAMLRGGLPTSYLERADYAPNAGELVNARGFSGGPELLVFPVFVVNPGWVMPGEDYKSAVYTGGALPGMSGSPILNKRGEVVGIFSGNYKRNPSAGTPIIGWGCTFEQLKDFVGPVWEGVK